ncbi:MAG TPA: N-acetylglucosamine-6-phosphate deacetylase [Planctomycetota bacterium]
MRKGLIDIHFHGQGGLDVMSRDPDDLLKLSQRVAKQGVAGFLATYITSPLEKILAALENLKKVQGREKGATILGAHLEGPFLHPARKGAHNPKHLRPPDLKEVREWVAAGEGLVKLVTLAPELPGMEPVIRFLVKKGVRVSMGHSTADSRQALAGKKRGATSVTHLFNAMNPLHHREPGLVGFALGDPDLYTELIGDGVHVSDEIAKLVLRIRPADKIILISDGFFLTGLKKGRTFSFSGVTVKSMPDGSLRLPDGTLAGGNLTIRDIVDRIIRLRVCSPADVLAMASTNPLRMLGLA